MLEETPTVEAEAELFFDETRGQDDPDRWGVEEYEADRRVRMGRVRVA